MPGKFKWTNSTIDSFLVDNNRTLKRVSDSHGCSVNINWQCLNCDYVWSARPYNIIHSDSACPKCSKNIKMSDADIDFLLSKNNRRVKRIGTYVNSGTPITWQCLDCFYLWDTVPNSVVCRGRGCNRCAGHLKLTDEEIDTRLVSRTLPVKRLGEYTNYGTKIDWQCTMCNHIFTSSVKMVFLGYGCVKCFPPSCSSGENIIESILVDFGVDFIKEKIFYDCVNPLTNRKMRFDFYVSAYNLCIEFDGEQHYKPMFPSPSHPTAPFIFEALVFRDVLKNNYCLLNGIKLLRIPYKCKTQKKIKERITEALK